MGGCVDAVQKKVPDLPQTTLPKPQLARTRSDKKEKSSSPTKANHVEINIGLFSQSKITIKMANK